ncbi:hypothetical protein BH23PLA1_BH23PLA1_24540 [soil metagenome]
MSGPAWAHQFRAFRSPKQGKRPGSLMKMDGKCNAGNDLCAIPVSFTHHLPTMPDLAAVLIAQMDQIKRDEQDCERWLEGQERQRVEDLGRELDWMTAGAEPHADRAGAGPDRRRQLVRPLDA